MTNTPHLIQSKRDSHISIEIIRSINEGSDNSNNNSNNSNTAREKYIANFQQLKMSTPPLPSQELREKCLQKLRALARLLLPLPPTIETVKQRKQRVSLFQKRM